jgi:hypothetical protein
VQLPAHLAAQVGYDVVIADSGNHALRGLRLADTQITTIAGTGEQWMQGDPTAGSATQIRLSTPWDVEFLDGTVYITMAGEHRIWAFDPVAGTVRVHAGTTNEGLVDGDLAGSWFAQPSAIVTDGSDLWVGDSETSALRSITGDHVVTHIGRGLFDFGHVDGPANTALLQHPLGLAITADGRILVADTYNGAVRSYDPSRQQVTTLLRDLAEPSDVVIDPRGDRMLVVEAAAGRLTWHPMASESVVSGDALRTVRPGVDVQPGELRLEIRFDPPPGQKRDDRFGPSTHLVVSASPPDLLTAGSGSGSDLVRVVSINDAAGDGVLHVAAKGASCDISSDESPNPACHIHQQDWGIPIRVTKSGVTQLTLSLSG